MLLSLALKDQDSRISDNHRVKFARPSLVQSGKPGTGGTSGLRRTA